MSVLDASELPAPHPDTERPSYPPKVRPTRVSEWERADSYRGVLFPIPNTNWRVAVCREGRQWLLQQREAKDHWESRKYFARKGRLATVIRDHLGEAAFQSVQSKIEALPT